MAGDVELVDDVEFLGNDNARVNITIAEPMSCLVLIVSPRITQAAKAPQIGPDNRIIVTFQGSNL